jgi:Na+/H+ antiporter NhaD/arsenite permease-like protein
LAGIFILVGSLSATGWVETIARGLGSLIGGNVLGGYILLIVVSVIASAFIDNIPFLATMLPVASSVATGLQVEPFLFLAALLIGTSLGGNITPIGASANIVACGILKREGHPVSFGQFMKIGLPFTLAAVIVGSIFIWFVWR